MFVRCNKPPFIVFIIKRWQFLDERELVLILKYVLYSYIH